MLKGGVASSASRPSGAAYVEHGISDDDVNDTKELTDSHEALLVQEFAQRVPLL